MIEILLIYLVFVTAVFLGTIKEFNNLAYTPKEIYECNNCNMFVCILLFIVLLVLNPFFSVAKFLYWIFHVGRKKIDYKASDNVERKE